MTWALGCSDSSGVLSLQLDSTSNGYEAVCSAGYPVVVQESTLSVLSASDVSTLAIGIITVVALAAAWRVVLRMFNW